MVKNYKLVEEVINKSVNTEWQEAVCEWKIEDCIEDESASSSCICGKDNIRYLYTIKNILNGETLFPIGSSCINKFEREDLRDETNVRESMFRLLHAVDEGKYISLNSEFFSRKLLKSLSEEGAFAANKFNDYDPIKDYNFMLKMFNKKDKSDISQNQHKKIRGIIRFSIIPHVQKKLNGKIISEK